MAEDISRNTIWVLVILTLLISVLGTWTVLSQIDASMGVSGGEALHSSQGKVSLTILPPPEANTGSAQGEVALTINEPTSSS